MRTKNGIEKSVEEIVAFIASLVITIFVSGAILTVVKQLF